MPRKSKTPLDPKGREVLFYSGDWERLTEILAPKKITPSQYIRELIRNRIRRLEDLNND